MNNIDASADANLSAQDEVKLDEETKKFYENLNDEDKELFKQCWCNIRIFRRTKLIHKLNNENLSDRERRKIKDAILNLKK